MECNKTNIKGRGASIDVKNRFVRDEYVPVESEWFEDELKPSPKTQFLRDSSRSILSHNQSPDVGFDTSINPYRGCEHGCIYCYARPTHEYLGFSPGLDFETKIVVKHDAPKLLKAALSSRAWVPRTIIMSGVTDCYQPIERQLKLTRGCLEVLAECRNPVALITKNFLVTRDRDLLAELARHHACAVILSVTTLDEKLCGILEPRTSRPKHRLEAISELSNAGIPVSVNVAPIIPGITDHEIGPILQAAREAGATGANYVLLRLPYAVKDLFENWLSEHFPDRKNKVLARIRALRSGKLNDPNFQSRMRGQGIFASMIEDTFSLWHRKLGFSQSADLNTGAFIRPRTGNQLELF